MGLKDGVDAAEKKTVFFIPLPGIETPRARNIS
jgi:hypothetical protein